jgi:hypothetical protein
MNPIESLAKRSSLRSSKIDIEDKSTLSRTDKSDVQSKSSVEKPVDVGFFSK